MKKLYRIFLCGILLLVLSVFLPSSRSIQAKELTPVHARTNDAVTSDQVIQYLQDNGYDVFSVEEVPLTGQWKCSTGKDGAMHTTYVVTLGDEIVGHFDIDV
jgi:hypothetical protein